MNYTNHILTLLFLTFSFSFAQDSDDFGKVTYLEKEMIHYEKDPQASAVVLYERGDNYFKVIRDRIRLVKKYHVKIKIFDEKAFEEANISIRLRKYEKQYEKLSKIRAVTHNGNDKFNVLEHEIFEKDLNEYITEKTFTFPKVQKGSILEYSYTILSPFFYNFRGWDFQSNIPKIYSEFNAEIPGNYVYNRALIGSLNLNTNEATLKRNCFSIQGFAKSADCEVLKYVMKDIPAFKVEEDYMLSPSNYISRLDFELSEYNHFDGTTDRYTKTWRAVDKEFRGDKNIGRQLTKKGFFENQIPEDLLLENDKMTKARNIYSYVQNHFTWNEEYGIFRKARVKEAFEAKKGNVSEINMSLINLLNAAGIPTNLMLLSTRNSGLPKKIHPIMNDFNYAVTKTTIDGKDFLLDASNKYLPFGMLPFKALNQYGRVMDFKNDSYWYDIKPYEKNRLQARVQLKFDIDQKMGYGIIDLLTSGYNAVDTRIAKDQYSKDEYLELWEDGAKGDLEITSYNFFTERSDDSKTSERFEFELQNVLSGEMIYLNPFLIRFFKKNPFNLEERNYPVDFGHKRVYRYRINIDIPDGFEVSELPENKVIQLGEDLVKLTFYHKTINNRIAISFELALNEYHFTPSDYQGLKEIFTHVTNIQNNTVLVLKKI